MLKVQGCVEDYLKELALNTNSIMDEKKERMVILKDPLKKKKKSKENMDLHKIVASTLMSTDVLFRETQSSLDPCHSPESLIRLWG